MSEAALEEQPTDKAPQTPTTKEPAAVAREGRVHTGDVLREVEDLKRRQTTVERELGIVASGEDEEPEGASSDEHDRGGEATPRRNYFEDVERELWGDSPKAAPEKPAPKPTTRKKS